MHIVCKDSNYKVLMNWAHDKKTIITVNTMWIGPRNASSVIIESISWKHMYGVLSCTDMKCGPEIR